MREQGVFFFLVKRCSKSVKVFDFNTFFLHNSKKYHYFEQDFTIQLGKQVIISMVAIYNTHLNRPHQASENMFDRKVCIHFLGKEKGYELTLVG